LEKDGWEWVDMICFQGAQNIGLSNHRLKSALTCTVWSQCITLVADGQTDGQTDEHHVNSATIHSNERITRMHRALEISAVL